MRPANADLYKTVTYRNVFLCKEDLPHILHSNYAIEKFPFAQRLDLFAVVEPGKRALFFDVGKPELCGTKALDHIVDVYGIPWSNIQIVISHFHDDHDGALSYCVKKGVKDIYHGSAVWYSSERKARFLMCSGIRAHQDERELAPYVDFFLLKHRFSEEVFNCLHEVSEGTVFSLAGYNFEVVCTPGHTAEHISLFEPDKKILFAGDFILDAAPGVMQFVPESNMVERYLQSLAWARHSHLQALFMSHHDSLFDATVINALIDKQIASYDHPLKKVMEQFVHNEWLDPYEVAERYCSHQEGGLAGMDANHRVRKVAMMCGYLDCLTRRGLLVRKTNEDGRALFARALFFHK